MERGRVAELDDAALSQLCRPPLPGLSYAVWLYFRFPLSLRHVDEILAARGVVVSHETVRQWGLNFGQSIANQIRCRLPRAGDTWHLDEVAVRIAGKKHGFCNGPSVSTLLSADPVAGVLLLSGVGAWPPPDGVG